MAKLAKQTALPGPQEIFCLEYVRCGVASEAYRHAYKVKENTKKSSVYVNASKLMADAKIAQRIKALWDEAAEVTMGELVAGYRQARDIGLEDRNSAGVNGAVTGLARIKGYLKDDPAKAGDIHIHFDAAMKGLG